MLSGYRRVSRESELFRTHLDISMHKTQIMDTLDSHGNLCDEEPRNLFGEGTTLREQSKQIPSLPQRLAVNRHVMVSTGMYSMTRYKQDFV